MSQPNNSNGGLIDQAEVNTWKGRFNKALQTKEWNQASPASARPWSNGFFSCFSPPDLCLTTCCVPCVTFGKTTHRLRHGNMDTYEPVNTNCLLFSLSTCIGAHWILQAMQLADIRDKHNLQGNCITDLAKSFCCACCSIVQAEKESAEREAEGRAQVMEQYGNKETMVMPATNQ